MSLRLARIVQKAVDCKVFLDRDSRSLIEMLQRTNRIAGVHCFLNMGLLKPAFLDVSRLRFRDRIGQPFSTSNRASGSSDFRFRVVSPWEGRPRHSSVQGLHVLHELIPVEDQILIDIGTLPDVRCEMRGLDPYQSDDSVSSGTSHRFRSPLNASLELYVTKRIGHVYLRPRQIERGPQRAPYDGPSLL